MKTQYTHDEPLFAIGVVARLVGVHQQTLRNYERWGFVLPHRSAGGTRWYSQRDVQQVRKIREWIDMLGINRAGVEVMLRLIKRVDDLEGQLEALGAQIERVRRTGHQL